MNEVMDGWMDLSDGHKSLCWGSRGGTGTSQEESEERDVDWRVRESREQVKVGIHASISFHL